MFLLLSPAAPRRPCSSARRARRGRASSRRASRRPRPCRRRRGSCLIETRRCRRSAIAASARSRAAPVFAAAFACIRSRYASQRCSSASIASVNWSFVAANSAATRCSASSSSLSSCSSRSSTAAARSRAEARADSSSRRSGVDVPLHPGLRVRRAALRLHLEAGDAAAHLAEVLVRLLSPWRLLSRAYRCTASVVPRRCQAAAVGAGRALPLGVGGARAAFTQARPRRRRCAARRRARPVRPTRPRPGLRPAR